MKLVATCLVCDTTGCGATFPPDGFRPGDDVRMAARRAGWERDFDADRCPEHKSTAGMVEQVRQLAAKGITDERIGTRFGVSRAVIRTIRLANGIPGQRPGRPRSAA